MVNRRALPFRHRPGWSADGRRRAGRCSHNIGRFLGRRIRRFRRSGTPQSAPSLQADAFENFGERHARPFADGAPAFDESWRVIWVRWGRALSSASDSERTDDEAIDPSRQLANFSFECGIFLRVGHVVPLSLKSGDISAALNSRASDLRPPSRRWTDGQTLGLGEQLLEFADPDSLSQPPSTSRRPATLRPVNLRAA